MELTRGVCARAGKVCAIVTVPWESIWPSAFSRFGCLHNRIHYAGEGYHSRWFYCAVGIYNTIARQQSLAFMSTYTYQKGSSAGFVVHNADATTFPADAKGKVVGLVSSWV